MHELSIAQNIVEIVGQYLPPGESRAVKSVRLRVGALTEIVPDSLIFAFEVASQGTPVEGAELEIERVPIVCRCRDCGSVFEAGRDAFICPDCKAPCAKVISGDELDVVELELAA